MVNLLVCSGRQVVTHTHTNTHTQGALLVLFCFVSFDDPNFIITLFVPYTCMSWDLECFCGSVTAIMVSDV